MKEQILSKVLNKDGSLIWAFSKSQYIQKYFTPEELKYLRSCFGKTISEKYYCLKHGLTEQPKCPCCGKPLKFNSFKEGYHTFCSTSCRSKSTIFTEESKNKRRKTNLGRFGSIGGPWNSFETKEKVKKTNNKKYGSDSPFSSKDIRQKSKETINNRYGSLANAHKELHSDGFGFGNKKIVEKQKETMMAKYGVDNYNKLDSVKQIFANGRAKVLGKQLAKRQIQQYGTMWVNTPEAQKFISRKYVYHGDKFDSSWELYYWIWCKDQGYNITRNFNYFQFILDNKPRRFYPDFNVNSQLVEIKGDHLKSDVYKDRSWIEKEKICKKNNIKIISESEMKPIIKWVQNKYGKKYVQQFKQKTEKDIKRQIIEFSSLEETFKYRNSNVRFHYKCRECGQDVYTTYYLLSHFNDNLCKHCRKKTTN